ncbi:MAG: alpha/beta fold hydrolase [Deltaproteobacteria bacterium]|nr:alpha/beta fold hydrolase [Deltaproteobacteria bacterium]
MSKRFVLIHGAWHGGWCWDKVVRELEDRGHTAEAPTLPGMNPGDDRSRVTFDDYREAIAETLRSRPEPAVLVGHSSAGFLLQAAAPDAPDRIERLVFLNAFVVPDNHAQFDLVPPEVAQGMTALAEASPDASVPVIEDFVRGALLAGESREVQDDLMARLSPQPLVLFTTKVRTGPFEALDVPKTYLFCRDDQTPAPYREMARGLGDCEFMEIEGGHETLWLHPERVAEALVRAAG